METNELITALRQMKVETGSLICFGCGHEHSCSTRGCALICEAANRLDALCGPATTLQSGWLSVEERLPEGEKCVITDGMLVAIDSEKGARRRALRGFITHWMPLPAPPERTEQGADT